MKTLEKEVKLNLGCNKTYIPGFLNVDINKEFGADIVTNVKDLSMFESGSICELYASNILEHFPHTETLDVLKEWSRVLKTGGKLHISVPDFDFCIDFYIKTNRALQPWLVNYMYGDQKGPQEFHQTPFNWSHLRDLLDKAGFSQAKRVHDLPYGIADTSKLRESWFGLPTALNAEAVK